MPEILTLDRRRPSILSVMKPYGDKDAGDLSIRWSRDNTAEIAAAKATFDAMKAKGYVAYKTNSSGDRGEVIRTFDPQAERITMAPQMVGG
jgi:hypothetical protein